MLKSLLITLGLILSCQAFAADSVVLTKDNTIAINDVFWSDTVSVIIKKAKELDARVQSSDPIYLVINSPGGSIDAGLELIENLKSLKRPVHTISIFSASMGFQTVQGLGDRLVLANGTLMSHRARGGFYGEFPGQLDTRYQYYLKRVLRMDELAAKRSGGKLTLDAYHRLIQDEYWCDGQDCVNQGLADRVTSAQCDKSLEGTSQVSVFQDIFMGHTIELKAEYDNCPLNTNALKYVILVDGQPLFMDSTQSTVKKVASDDPSLSSSFFGSSYRSSYETPSAPTPIIDKLGKDELFQINQKVQGIISKKTNKEVVKGY
jgi:ATP-dependent Clp protease protease subunit